MIGALAGVALFLLGLWGNQQAHKRSYSWGRGAGLAGMVLGYFLLLLSIPREWWVWFGGSAMRTVFAISTTFVVAGLVGAIGAYLLIQDAAHDAAPPAPATAPAGAPEQGAPNVTEKPPTLLGLFEQDFPMLLKSGRARNIGRQDPGQAKSLIEIREQLYYDFLAKSKFVGFYLPSSDSTVGIALFLADHPYYPFDLARSVGYGGIVGEATKPNDLVFTGRVYLYHEDLLSIEEQAEIVKRYKERNLAVTLRGPDYHALRLIAWGADRK